MGINRIYKRNATQAETGKRQSINSFADPNGVLNQLRTRDMQIRKLVEFRKTRNYLHPRHKRAAGGQP